jgi:hypothetical protein
MRRRLLALGLSLCTALSLSAAPTDSALSAALLAHGGMSRWNSIATAEFDLVHWPFSAKPAEALHVLTDVRNRRTLVLSDGFRMSFDGTRYWITPDLQAAGMAPRHFIPEPALIFSMPFIFHKAAAVVAVEPAGEVLEATLASEPGVTYTLTFSTAPAQLRYVTITPAPGSRQFNLYQKTVTLAFNHWQDVKDLRLPKSVEFFEGTAKGGTSIGTIEFRNVSLSDDGQEPELFALPAGAVVDEH